MSIQFDKWWAHEWAFDPLDQEFGPLVFGDPGIASGARANKNVIIHFEGDASAGSTKNVIIHFPPGGVAPPDFTATIELRFPRSKLSLAVQKITDVAIVFKTKKPSLAVVSLYDNNVYRPGIGNYWGLPHDEGTLVGDTHQDQPWVLSLTSERPLKDLPWDTGQLRGVVKSGNWRETDHSKRDLGKDISWREGDDVSVRWGVDSRKAIPARPYGTDVNWREANPEVVHTSAQPWTGILVHIKKTWREAWEVAKHLGNTWKVFDWGVGIPLHVKDPGVLLGGHKIPWREAKYPDPGVSAPPPGPPGGPPPPPPRPNKNVLIEFICPWLDYGHKDVPIHFLPYPCPEAGGQLYVPIRRLYMILNEILMHRDGNLIRVSSCSLSTDQSSWAWSMTANIAAADLPLVEPDVDGPQTVTLIINGVTWKFLVESYDRRRTFGDSQVTIRGRSITAVLDAPYAPTRNYKSPDPFYSKALVEAEMALMPGMWDLDWPTLSNPSVKRRWEADDGLSTGWLIPAGTYSYSGKTPMQAINELIQSVGGYVQSHTEDAKLIVSSAYPVPPWGWGAASADLTIPKSVIKGDSLQWLEKPLYNRVFVTGEQVGVNALVRNTAITPDLQAPQYVHKYMTDQYAAREKGKNIISAGGRQANFGIEVPLDSTINLGLITPGMLLAITDPLGQDTTWKGITRSITLNASASDREIVVTQSVTIERHY
jgi:hypothetical protein